MISSELAFPPRVAPLVRDVRQYRTSVIYPLPGWSSGAQNIVFSIPSSEREYLSSQFVLNLEFCIKKADGSDVEAGKSVTFLNLPIASFFSSARLALNGTIIEGQLSFFIFLSSLFSYILRVKQQLGHANVVEQPAHSVLHCQRILWQGPMEIHTRYQARKVVIDLDNLFTDDPFKSQTTTDAGNAGMHRRLGEWLKRDWWLRLACAETTLRQLPGRPRPLPDSIQPHILWPCPPFRTPR